MNAATFLILYAATLSWLAPVFLSNAAPTQHPRLAVAGWLAAVGTAISAWVGALVILCVGAVHALITSTALTFCVQTLGLTDAVHLPTSVATALTIALLAVTAVVALHTGRRVLHAARATRRSNHSHAETVHILGRPTPHPGLLSIDSERAAVYCVASGRHSAIIATTAALQMLDPAGLAAVLTHERAHLRGGHHHILATLNALAAALPRLPLMRAAAQSVPPLLEMCADDVAARAHGRAPLLTSLVLLSTGQRLPAGALAAAGTAVLERVRRLTQPAPTRSWRTHSYLCAVALTCAAPTVAALFCR
ncbi:peptidase M56 [Mycobacterium sp. SWH-M3]|nr:peptidase M56 [Mycobacterium sp. SWH-M3]